MGSTLMYETSEYHKKTCTQQIDSSIGNMLLYGAGSDLIKSELGAYGEKVLGSSSAYVQNNVSIIFFRFILYGIDVKKSLTGDDSDEIQYF